MAKRLSWAVRLARAKQRGKFSAEDLALARDWATCLIGERHGFKEMGTLLPDEFALGGRFPGAVWDQDIPEAERIYALVQALPPVEVKA